MSGRDFGSSSATANVMADNNETLGKISAFYGISEDRLIAIDRDILMILENKTTDINELKSQNLRLSVTVDEIKTVSSKREEGLKSEIEKLLGENESVRLERSQAREESIQSSRDKQKIQNEIESLQDKLSDLNQERELLKQNKREVVSLLEEKVNELESFRKESQKSVTENKQLRQLVLELETHVQNLKSRELRDQSEIQTLSQQLNILQRNNDWLEQEVTSKTEQLIATRRRNDDELEHLTSGSLSSKNELQVEKSRNQIIASKNDELTRSLQEKLIEIKDLSDSLYREKQEFAHEMSMKQKLIDLLDNQIKSLQGELNASLDKDDLEVNADGEKNKETEKLIQELISLKNKFEESEQERLRLEALVQELIPEEQSQDNISTNNSGFFSLRESGSSLRDVGILKKELLKERHQKERLQRQVEAFIVELEYKIPIINSFKERTSTLESELNDIALLLEHISNEKEKNEREFDALSKKIKDSESAIHVLTKQRTDLAYQVRFLLMSVTLQADSRGPLTAEDVSFIKRIVDNDNPGGENDSQSVISERLVEFNNIVTLQEKNMELLKTVRSLAEKLEAEEKDVNKKIQTVENNTIKDAKEAIVSLQNYNGSLESKVEILTKERDAFKAISSQEGTGHNGSATNGTADKQSRSSDTEKITTLEARLTSLTVESAQNNKMLNNEIQELYKSKTQSFIELERERSSKALAEERLKLVQHTLDLKKSESEELVKRSQNLQKILEKQDSRTTETVDELIACNSKLAVLETKVLNLEAEKELLQASERTSRENYLKLSEERNSLRIMVSQLQTLQSERERFLQEIQSTYKESLTRLEEEKIDVKARWEAKTKEAEEAESSKRTQVQWYQDKLDSVVANSQSLKQELQNKTSVVVDLESEIKNLQKQVDEGEARIQSYQVLNGSELEASPESSLRKELEKSKLHLSDTYAELDHYKNLLSTTEESLSQLTQEYANNKQQWQSQLKVLQNEKSELREVIDERNEKLNSLTESLENINKVAESEKSELQKKIAGLEAEHKNVQQAREEYFAQIAKLQGDLEQQASFANRAQRNYEEELQKDSNVSKTISELREQNQKDRIEITRLKNFEEQTRKVLDQNEESWSAQREEYERQLETSKQHLEDLSTQNNLLYDQIELFSKGKDEGTNGETPEIRDILTNLRRERDILGTKLTVSQREEQTLRKSLTTVENELDTTKRQLSHFQKEITTHSELIGQHEKIMEQLNQLNLLRESNITLRNAAEEANKKNRELESELDQLHGKILPLESEINSLQSSVLEKNQQSNLYGEEANRWKERSQEILHKHDRIDPEDHRELKEKVSTLGIKLDETNKENEELNDRFNRLKKQAHEKLNSSKISQTTLTNQLNELREAKTELESRFEDEERKVRELQERLSFEGDATETAESVRRELNEALENSRETGQRLHDVLKENEEVTKRLTGEIDSLKLELNNLREQKEIVPGSEEIPQNISHVVESMRSSFEQEKINFLKEKTEEFRKLEEERLASDVNANEKQVQPPNYGELQKQWEMEYEESTLKRIAEAEENLKKRIRLPTEEKIKQIVEKKRAVLEEQYKKKLEENKATLSLPGNDETEVRKQLEKEIQERFDAELKAVKKRAFEEGKQQAAMKSTLLERKISKLESQLHGKSDSPDKSTSEVSSVPKPNLPTKIDEKSVAHSQNVPNPLVSGEKVLKLDPSKPAFNVPSFSGGNPFTSSPQNNDSNGTPAFGFKPTFTLSNDPTKGGDTKADSPSKEDKPANPFSSFTETGASSPERDSSNMVMTPMPGENVSTPSKRAAEDEQDNEGSLENKRPKDENA